MPVSSANQNNMKRLPTWWIAGALLLACAGCGTTARPYYETAEGKKKLAHYNRAQYGLLNKTGYYRRK